MLVHSPEKVVGKFMGFDILVRSKNPVENMTTFEAVCATFEDRLMFINSEEK